MQTETRVGNSVHVDGGARNYHHRRQQQLGAASPLLAGGIAGAVAKTCTAPLARLTILFQVQGMHSDVRTLSKPSIWREASRIVYEEGFRAFWKGNLVTIVHRLPYSSISFYAYERYKTYLQLVPGLDKQEDYVGADVCVRLLGGGLAGVTAASVTYPLDLVRTRLAAQTNHIYYRGISHALHSICKDEGMRGLYKGLGATLLGVGPSIAISFAVYETLRSHWHLKRPSDSAVFVSLACGSLAGIASSTATFPLDLVRRRMQLEGAAGRDRVYKTGIFGTFRHIIRCEGFGGLYRDKHSIKCHQSSFTLQCLKSKSMKHFIFFILVLFVSIILQATPGSSSFVSQQSVEDGFAQSPGADYQGAGTESHHTIDPKTWGIQHPKPPCQDAYGTVCKN